MVAGVVAGDEAGGGGREKRVRGRGDGSNWIKNLNNNSYLVGIVDDHPQPASSWRMRLVAGAEREELGVEVMVATQ